MMGLLDSMDDPRTMGLLSLGMGLLGSKGSFGNALSQAGPQALQAMRQVKQDQARKEQMEQAQKMQALQMQQAQMQMAEQQRQQALMQGRQTAFKGAFVPGMPGVGSPNGDMTGDFTAPGTAPSLNMGKYLQALVQGGDVEGAMPIYQSMQKDDTPVALSDGGMLVRKDGTIVARNPKDTTDKMDPLQRLIALRDALPVGHPNRKVYEAAITKASTHQPATSVTVQPDNLGLKPIDRFKMEGDLSGEFKTVTKLDTLVLDATRKIKTALAQPGAMKDQAAIYSMAKMLDPEGAVREADYAAISNTAGLVDRVKGYLNRLATGEQLSETQRNEMLGMMTAFEGVATRRIGSAKSDFSTRAKRYNLDPDSVFSGSVNTEAPKPPAGAPKPTKRWNPATRTFEPLGG